MNWENIIIKRREGVNYEMTINSPQEALNVIAALIDEQAPLKEQDAWLDAVRVLGYVEDPDVRDLPTDESQFDDVAERTDTKEDPHRRF